MVVRKEQSVSPERAGWQIRVQIVELGEDFVSQLPSAFSSQARPAELCGKNITDIMQHVDPRCFSKPPIRPDILHFRWRILGQVSFEW